MDINTEWMKTATELNRSWAATALKINDDWARTAVIGTVASSCVWFIAGLLIGGYIS